MSFSGGNGLNLGSTGGLENRLIEHKTHLHGLFDLSNKNFALSERFIRAFVRKFILFLKLAFFGLYEIKVPLLMSKTDFAVGFIKRLAALRKEITVCSTLRG